MNDDFFKSLDPAGESNDSLLAESRGAWKELASKRRDRLRWRYRGLVAATCAMLAGGLFYVGFWEVGRSDRGFTTVSKEEPRAPLIEVVEDSTPVRSREIRSSRIRKLPATLTLTAFRKEIDRAGKVGTLQWKQVVADLVASPASIQRESVDLVARVEDREVQRRAMRLVGEAAGRDEKRLLAGWLNHPKTRDAAWERCLAIAPSADLLLLSETARGESEKRKLCERLWEIADQEAADALVSLVASPQWQRAVRSSAHNSARELPMDWTLRLVKQLRDRNVKTRTATAFVLASIPGEQLDRLLAEMVTQGRYRQPCYLTLMSRDTKVAKSFLVHAARHQALAPALVSARSHFNVMARQLNYWKELSQGDSDEDSRKRSDAHPAVHAAKLAIARVRCMDGGWKWRS